LAALGLLVAITPLLLAMIVLIRITSGGPALYSQWRSGHHGRQFKLYKLRTMHQDAEALTGAIWAPAGDRRITSVGRVLRRLHLDELPQLWNVLRGEMLFVGPRPERPELIPGLIENVPGYSRRMAIAPGITGLAQINLPADSDYNSVRRKLVLDCEYIASANLFLDFRIVLCTLVKAVGIHSPWIRVLLRVHRNPPLRPYQAHPSHQAISEQTSPLFVLPLFGASETETCEERA
jgi:lipopolysaccharide/colanic/teichoic acid biosynthesis glycosyltransferase